MYPLDLYDPSSILNPTSRRAATNLVPPPAPEPEIEVEQPQEEQSIVGSIGGSLLDGLSTVGYALDVLGRPIRRGLAGEDPMGAVDVSGRDLLERWGLAGENKPGLFNDVSDFAGDVGGFALEVATDPFTYAGPGITKKGLQALAGARAAKSAASVSAGAASKAGLAARSLEAKMASITKAMDNEADDAARFALGEQLKGLKAQHAIESAAEIAAKEANAKDVAKIAEAGYGDTWAEQVRRGQRALLSIGNPFSSGEAQSLVSFGTGETAAKFAEPFSQAAKLIKTSKPGAALMGLFDPLAGGASTYEAQEIARKQADKQLQYGAESADQAMRLQELWKEAEDIVGQAPPKLPEPEPEPFITNPYSDLPLASSRKQVPGQGGFKEDFDRAFAELDTKDRNMVPIHQLREEMPQYTQDQFNAEVRKLREKGVLSADSSEGDTVTFTDPQRATHIKEGGTTFAYLGYKDRASKPTLQGLAQAASQPIAGHAEGSIGDLLRKLAEVDVNIMDPIVNSGLGAEVGITNNEFFRTLSALYEDKLRIKNEFGLSPGDLKEWKDAVTQLELRTAAAEAALRRIGKSVAADAYSSTMPRMIESAEKDLFGSMKQATVPPKKPDIAEQAMEAMGAGTQYKDAPTSWRNAVTKLVQNNNMTYQEGEDVMNAMGSVAAGMASAWGKGARDNFLKSIDITASPRSTLYRFTEGGVTKEVKAVQAWKDASGNPIALTRGMKNPPEGAVTKGTAWADDTGRFHKPAGNPNYMEIEGTTENIVSKAGDIKALITLYKQADPKTFVHEFIHAVTPHIPQSDLKVLSEFVARETGQAISDMTSAAGWTPAHHEALARQWEIYHATGVAPTTALQAVFERLKIAFKKAYESIHQTLEQMGVVDKNVKEVFDSWYKAGEGAPLYETAGRAGQPMPAKMPRKAASARQTKAKDIITPIDPIPLDQLNALPVEELARRWSKGDMEAMKVLAEMTSATIDGFKVPFGEIARKVGFDIETSIESVNQAIANISQNINVGKQKELGEGVIGYIVNAAKNIANKIKKKGAEAAAGEGNVVVNNAADITARTAEDSDELMRQVKMSLKPGSKADKLLDEWQQLETELLAPGITEETAFALRALQERLLKQVKADPEWKRALAKFKEAGTPAKPAATSSIPDMLPAGEKPTKKPGSSPLASRLKKAAPVEAGIAKQVEEVIAPAAQKQIDDAELAEAAAHAASVAPKLPYSGDFPSLQAYLDEMDRRGLDMVDESQFNLSPQHQAEWDARTPETAARSEAELAELQFSLNPVGRAAYEAARAAGETHGWALDAAEAAMKQPQAPQPQVLEWVMPTTAPARAPANIEASLIAPAAEVLEPRAAPASAVQEWYMPESVPARAPASVEASLIEPPPVAKATKKVAKEPAAVAKPATKAAKEGEDYFASRKAKPEAAPAKEPEAPSTPPPVEPPKPPAPPDMADGLPPPDVPKDIPPDLQRVMNKLVQRVKLDADELRLISKDPTRIRKIADEIRREYDIEAQNLYELGVLSRSGTKRLPTDVEFQHQQSRVAKEWEIEEATAKGKKTKTTKSFFDPFWETITGQMGKYTGRLVAPLKDFVTQSQKEQFQGFKNGVEGVNDFIRQWGGKAPDETMLNALRVAKEDKAHFQKIEHLQATADTISKIKLKPGQNRFFDVDSATALFAYKQRIAKVKAGAEATHGLFAEMAEKEGGKDALKMADALGEVLGKSLDDKNLVLGRMLSDNAQLLAQKGVKSIDDLAEMTVPAEIIAQAKRFMRFNTTPEYLKPWLAALDWYTDIMKTSLTVMWPANITRNVTAGQYMNVITAGLKPTLEAMPGAAKIAMGQQLEGKLKQYHREMELYGVLDPRAGFRGYGVNRIDDVREIGEHRPTFSGLYAKNKEDTALQVPILKEWSAAGQTAAGTAEVFNRATHFIAMREQGKTPLEALQSTLRAQFDYRDGLTEFERQWMRRLMPFYSFARFNAAFTVDELMKHPGGALAQTVRAANVMREDADIPPWMGGKVVTPLGIRDDGKSATYLSGLGLPIEEAFERISPDARRTLQQHAAMLHPLIKAPLEYMTGTQMYSGRELSSLQEYPTGIPEIDQALFNSPASRAVTTFRTAADERKGIPEKALNLLTGAKVTDVDIDRAREAKRRDDIRRALEASGKAQERKIITKKKGIALTPEEEELFKQYQRGSKKK